MLAVVRDMADHPRADLMFRLGLSSLVVPILGPYVWLTASRALGAEDREPRATGRTPRLVWGRRFGIAASVILVGIVATVLLGGQPVEAPQPR